MKAGTSPPYLSLLHSKTFIPQHEQPHEIKDTETLFNHFSIVLLPFAFTPHPVNLHGLLPCCLLISHPSRLNQPASSSWLQGEGESAGCQEEEGDET